MDLLWITDRGLRVGCEIKFSVSPAISRGFFEATKDLQCEKRYVLIPSGESYARSDGIQICSLADFLQTEMPRLQQL